MVANGMLDEKGLRDFLSKTNEVKRNYPKLAERYERFLKEYKRYEAKFSIRKINSR